MRNIIINARTDIGYGVGSNKYLAQKLVMRVFWRYRNNKYLENKTLSEIWREVKFYLSGHKVDIIYIGKW